MTVPRTDPELLARLMEAARNYRMTPQEVFDQRVSFIYGQMNGVWSKDRVRAHLIQRQGSP